MACDAWLELGSVNESARAVCKWSALRARSMYAVYVGEPICRVGSVNHDTAPSSAYIDRARSALRVCRTALADSFTLPSSSQAPQAMKRSAD